MYMVTA